ncbi:MAG: zinc-binding dehydrogenase [Anaerolineae bacterium]
MGVHAVRKVGVELGDTVAILGAGPIGLGLLLAARASGAAQIFVTDVSAYNLDIAGKMGATHVMDPSREDFVGGVLGETDGEGVDAVFLGVAVQSVLNDALRAVRRNGTVSEVAMFGKPPEIDIHLVQNKELRILSSNLYTRDDFSIAAAAVASGAFDTLLMISKIMPMDSVVEAFEIVDKRTEDVVKVLLRF